MTYGCIQPDERVDFGTYPGPAVDADGGASGGGSTGLTNGASSGVSSGIVPPGTGGTGSATTGGSSGGTTGVGSTGATGTANSGSSSGGTTGVANTGGASNGGASGATTGASTGSGSTAGSNGSTTGGASTGGGTTGGTSVSELKFSVTTTALGGRYQPKNIGAIWITNGTGTFVRTLEMWAGIRAVYLTRFASETKRNSVDAMTSATLTTHRMHAVTWDLTDLNGQVVPDGPYNIVIETTDKDGTGDSLSIPFMKGPPHSSSPADVTHYIDMSLQIQ